MPLDPRWVAAPPEIVALIFEGGPGPGSIVAYASVMATEAASHQMGMAVSAANIATTSASWTGLAGTANVARGTALNTGGLEPLAAHCAKHVMLAQAAVDAYTMAAPSVIPAVACQANRDLWGVLNATNWFGQNTPGIVGQDLQYFGRLLAAEFQRRRAVRHYSRLDRGSGGRPAAGSRCRRSPCRFGVWGEPGVADRRAPPGRTPRKPRPQLRPWDLPGPRPLRRAVRCPRCSARGRRC